MGPDRDLLHLYPRFRSAVRALLKALAEYAAEEMPGCEWRLIEGFRTAEYQAHLYAQGRTRAGRVVTHCDGVQRISNHQLGLAADFAPFRNGKPWWDAPARHWRRLGVLARELGLSWGGDWTKVRDLPHVEWPPGDLKTYELARRWLRRTRIRADGAVRT